MNSLNDRWIPAIVLLWLIQGACVNPSAEIARRPSFRQPLLLTRDLYWIYRKRLVRDFMVQKDTQGGYIPAASRRTNQSQLPVKWADGIIHLGWYIAVLATEYDLASRGDVMFASSGSETRATQMLKTMTELSAAIDSLERLRMAGPRLYDGLCRDSPGGKFFFIRDDVPEGFGRYFHGAIESDFQDAQRSECHGTPEHPGEVPDACRNAEMSQDQLYHMLLGLTVVSRIPALAETRPSREGQKFAGRVLDWVKQDYPVMRNPSCENRQVRRGGCLPVYWRGAQQAFAEILPEETDRPACNPVSSCLWQMIPCTGGFLAKRDDNLHMAMALASITDGWGHSTGKRLWDLSESSHFFLYPLLHAYLFPDEWRRDASAVELQELRAQTEQLLASAPPDGPSTKAPSGWRSVNRFLRTSDALCDGCTMEFNGLDYMLLYNLYRLVFRKAG